jgi:hypothetical protein
MLLEIMLEERPAKRDLRIGLKPLRLEAKCKTCLLQAKILDLTSTLKRSGP